MKSLHIPSVEIDVNEQMCREQVIAEAKKRELEVLYAFADGLTPRQVAKRLGIKVKTVDMYKTCLFTLCRAAWNLPDNKGLRYSFLHIKFAKRELSPQDRINCDQVIAKATKRQFDVLRAFADGLTPQQVADKLGISVKTVDTHKTSLLALCRNAWGLPFNEWLDYRFLNEKFGGFFQPCETGNTW